MEREKRYDKTLLIDSDDSKAIKDAAEHLKNGEVIGFPTETVYGLGCDARNGEAVKKVFEAKGRPADNPLICHIGDKDQIKDIVESLKKKHYQARHVCHAAILGDKPDVLKYSDDGEPSGTAGRPMLDILQGKNLTYTQN